MEGPFRKNPGMDKRPKKCYNIYWNVMLTCWRYAP